MRHSLQTLSLYSAGNIYFLKTQRSSTSWSSAIVVFMSHALMNLYSSETNLKVKQAISVTCEMEDNLKLLSAFDGESGNEWAAHPNVHHQRTK